MIRRFTVLLAVALSALSLTATAAFAQAGPTPTGTTTPPTTTTTSTPEPTTPEPTTPAPTTPAPTATPDETATPSPVPDTPTPAPATPPATEPAQCPDMSLSASVTGSTLTVKVDPANVNIKPATQGDPTSFHLHYFMDLDPATIIVPGQPIPLGNPKIIHSASLTQSVASLAPGQHTVWVVAARLNHVPCAGGVMTSVSFTTSAPKPPATGDSLSAGRDGTATLFAAGVAVLLVTSAGAAAVRTVRK